MLLLDISCAPHTIAINIYCCPSRFYVRITDHRCHQHSSDCKLGEDLITSFLTVPVWSNIAPRGLRQLPYDVPNDPVPSQTADSSLPGADVPNGADPSQEAGASLPGAPPGSFAIVEQKFGIPRHAFDMGSFSNSTNDAEAGSAADHGENLLGPSGFISSAGAQFGLSNSVQEEILSIFSYFRRENPFV